MHMADGRDLDKHVILAHGFSWSSQAERETVGGATRSCVYTPNDVHPDHFRGEPESAEQQQS